MHPWRVRLSAVLHSLSFRLTLVSLLALGLGMAVITGLLVNQAERELLRAQQDREIRDVSEMAAILSRRVVNRQRALADTVRDLPLDLMLSDERFGQWLADQRALHGLFHYVYIADPDGDVRLQVDAAGVRHPVANVSDRAYFQQAMKERRPVVSDAVASRRTGAPLVVFAHPLIVGDRIVGLIGGVQRLAARDLVADLVDSGETHDGVQIIVTDEHANVLAHNDNTRLLSSLEEDAAFAPALADWRRHGASVEPEGLRVEHPQDMVTVAGVAGPDWLVWRVLPKAQLLAPLREARHDAIVSASLLVAVLAAVLMVIFISLLRPLGVLRQRARDLFMHPAATDQTWPDDASEIGELARALRRAGDDRARFESANQQVMKRLVSVMNAAPLGIAFTRVHRFELVSREFCRLVGRDEATLLKQPTRLIYSADQDYERLVTEAMACFTRGEPYQGEWRVQREDGGGFWADLRGAPVDPADLSAGAIWTISDVSAQVAEREQLAWSATQDALTGRATRRGFLQRLEKVFSAQPDSRPAAVMVIDLDHFKPINDLAGHAAGDAMLMAVAKAISAQVRTSDLVVRTGGDEFAVLLEHCTHDVALRLAEKVRQAISALVLDSPQGPLRVGASLGVASLHPALADMDAWLAAADEACYAAKGAGRGQVHSAGPRSLASGALQVVDSDAA